VASVTVSDELEEEGAIAFYSPFSGVLHSLLSSNYVHAVDLSKHETIARLSLGQVADLKSRDFITTSEILGIGGTALCRSSHSVFIVLAYKDTRKVPELGLKQKTD
jgi:hypothetical protein